MNTNKFIIYFSWLCFILHIPFYALSQCPGCIINTSCTISPPAPAMCPDTLPPGIAMQYYDQDVTFYMPAQFVDAGSNLNVTLNRIEVLGVVGLPYGLNFQSSSPTNNFYPSSNPPASERGCAKFCGTPVLPGNYIITVYVKAYVTVLGVNQTQNDSFEIPITILPAGGGAQSFSIASPVGCAPHTTSFTANYQSQGNPHYTYVWNFGNGQGFTGEFPPSQTYSQPGNYVVSLQTTIDTLGYYLSSVSISGNPSQCNDIFDGPDYFIKIYQGSTLIYQSNHVTNQSSVTFNFPTISLQNAIYSIEVWDNDTFLGGGGTGNDWCTTVSFNGHTAGSHYLVSNGLNISFLIDHPVLNFFETDTVVVYPSPVYQGANVYPAYQVCSGDSVILSTTGSYTWQWYWNNNAIAGATDSVYVAHESGQYHVNIMNQYGCVTSGSPITLTFMAYPPVPTFWQSGNTLQTMMTGYALQWFFNGNPIPGANGQTYTITQTGMYNLQASNSIGCSTMGNELYAIYTDIIELPITVFGHLSVYPNPANDFIQIEGDAVVNGTVVIAMNDLLNKQVFFRELQSNGAINERIYINDLPSGVYMLHVMHDNGSVKRKIVKQ